MLSIIILLYLIAPIMIRAFCLALSMVGHSGIHLQSLMLYLAQH